MATRRRDLPPAREASAPTSSPWLRTLVANIQDAIVVLDADGRVVFESPSAPDLLGPERADGDGSFGIHRIHPDEREAVIRSFERTISSPGAVARATYRFSAGDGGWRHLEAVAKNLLDDPELRGILITLRDVTDRIRALEAAERAGAATDEFLSRMSHELRTPLHAILGWAQLLQGRGDEEVAEAVDQILAAGEHLVRLVDEALDVAAVREGRIQFDMQPVEIGAVVADAIDMIRPLAARRDVRVRVVPDRRAGARAIADRIRLRQVLINLLANAIKYGRFAGDVRVAWRAEFETVRVSITDDGPGIPGTRLDSVFEPFERLGKESAGVEGSGLGLAISRRLVGLMGGTIGVESRPGEGAEFWLGLRRWPDRRVVERHPPSG